MRRMNTTYPIAEHGWRRPVVVSIAAGLLLAGCTKADQASSQRSAGAAAVTTTQLALPGQLCDPLAKEPVEQSGQKLYCEEVQAGGGSIVLDGYTNEAGSPKQTGHLEVGQAVLVVCLAEGPASIAPSAASNPSKPGIAEWYQLQQPVTGYAATNSFLNVTDRSVPFERQPTADPRVPAC